MKISRLETEMNNVVGQWEDIHTKDVLCEWQAINDVHLVLVRQLSTRKRKSEVG